ncbi:MAG: tetratricopeptide repeat protein [Planctomycetes bacterium]|nr:tetratricopeptide repeat protein [Planctomycetota bacterium]
MNRHLSIAALLLCAAVTVDGTAGRLAAQRPTINPRAPTPSATPRVAPAPMPRATPTPVAPRVTAPAPRVAPAPRIAPTPQAPTRVTPRAIPAPTPRTAPMPVPTRTTPFQPAPTRTVPTPVAPRSTPTVRTTPNPGFRTAPTPTPTVRTPTIPSPTRTVPSRTFPTPAVTQPRITVPTPGAVPGSTPTVRAGGLAGRYRDSTTPGLVNPSPASPRSPGVSPRTTLDPVVRDVSPRLRDLYARRDLTTRRPTDDLTPSVSQRRTDSVSGALSDRYSTRLRDDTLRVVPRSPDLTGRGAPSARTPVVAPRDPAVRVEPRTPDPTTPRLAPRNGGGVTPSVRVPSIHNRYNPPGSPGDPGTGLRDRGGNLGNPAAPGLRSSTRLQPRTAPTRSAVVPPSLGNGNGPRVNPGRRTGGFGSRYDPFAGSGISRGGGSIYHGHTYAGSRRYLNGCYHWAGHLAAFPWFHGRWGWYDFPFSWCGSWYRYYYNCNSSFALYWNSRYGLGAGVSWNWWWPNRCYLPGSYLGFTYYPDFAAGYTDWGYVPTSTVVVVDGTPPADTTVIVGADGVAGAAGEEPAAPAPEISPAQRHLDLGDFYFRRGRYDEAAESYMRALAYVPDDGSVHFVVADALFAQGDYHYAAYMIGKGLELDSGLSRADADKRTFYENPTDFDRQLATLRAYLAEKPYDAAAHLVLAYNLKFSGEPVEAVKAFARVLEIDPGNRAAKSFLEAMATPETPADGATTPEGGDGAKRDER